MSRSEIYTKFQFSVLNDSCLIHITIENCKISGENDLFIFLPGKIDQLRVREFYGECFIHILITLRFVLSWKSIFVIIGMRIADTRLLYDLGPTRKIGTKTTKKNNYFIASNEHIITNSSVSPKTTIL